MSEAPEKNKNISVIKKDITKLKQRVKLALILAVVMVIPVFVLTAVAWNQSKTLSDQLLDISTEEATTALRNSARVSVERIASDTADAVSRFLYQRDQDVLLLAGLLPSDEAYSVFSDTRNSRLTIHGEWVLADDGMSWVEKEPFSHNESLFPLYDEITFIDTDGKEIAKYVTPDSAKKRFPMNPDKTDVSKKANTYVKAETYWEELQNLKAGDIYVSGVVGAYTGTNYLGMYTPGVLLDFVPQTYPGYEELQITARLPAEDFIEAAKQQAFAGMENPVGQRFEGIIRWATPVTDYDESIIGYVTMALNHDFIMEFVEKISPVAEQHTFLSNAYAGNYAFIWDHKGQSIAHPRHHSIAGFDPLTGEPQEPWLDNRYLSNTRLFTDWTDLIYNGGSGSFYDQWADSTMLTAAGSIPYFTGNYAPEYQDGTKRGFGFVAVIADIEEFTVPAVYMEQRQIEAINTGSHEANTRLLVTSILLLLFVLIAAVLIAFLTVRDIKQPEKPKKVSPESTDI